MSRLGLAVSGISGDTGAGWAGAEWEFFGRSNRGELGGYSLSDRGLLVGLQGREKKTLLSSVTHVP